eukprot:TRINITY_DN8021_c2_g1_i2.p1 TRINITY_DN8021_c2_g1~~TRINITY_DN8021_c2_g1_i2.p1  ORF type:complete len:209 (-),score=40.91 TRINITY_DN8021_c2_g1_i2:100-726(-)
MKISWEIFFRVLGVGVGICLIIDGLFCFKYCKEKDWRDYIVSVLLMVFGAVLGLSEIGLGCLSAAICAPFAFLNSRLARGIMYIVCGALAITKLWWMVLISVIAIVVGVLNIIAAAKCLGNEERAKRDQQRDRELKDREEGIKANNDNNNNNNVPQESTYEPPPPSYTLTGNTSTTTSTSSNNPFLESTSTSSSNPFLEPSQPMGYRL